MPDAAFVYFTRDIGRWWPLSRHSCSGARAAGVSFERGEGGKLIETDVDGRQYIWDIVPAGAFVAAVGADSPDKSELVPELMAHATIVVDVLMQCAVMGDHHHAIDAGLVTTADVHAELGDLVIGRKPGRNSPEEITVFDSTGTAVQDAASAVWIYKRAIAGNIGSSIVL